MFDFIKKIFDKEVVEEISKEGLEDWFFMKMKESEKEVSSHLKEMKARMASKLSEILDALSSMEKTELHNPNIPIKEKQFMEGNRKTYLQRTRQLAREIEDILDLELSFFLEHYSEYIANFSKSTHRSFQILSNFFANELKMIGVRLRELDEVVKEFSAHEKVQRQTHLEKIKKGFLEAKEKEQRKKDLEKEIQKHNTEQKKISENLKEKKKKKEEHLQSSDYADLEQTKKKVHSLEKELKQMALTLHADFSPLDRSLKKYEHIALEHTKTIKAYLTNHLEALLSDKNLVIVSILSQVRNSIEKGSIQLKNKDKILGLISKLDKTYFSSFQKEYGKRLKDKEEAEKKIARSEIKENLETITTEIVHLQDALERITNELSSKASEKEAIDVLKMREKLKDEIEKVLSLTIKYT